MNRITTSLVFGFVAALGIAAAPAAEQAPTPLKLGGTWKLNKELSEDPGRKMMDAMRNAGGRGGGMGGPGGGGGMGPGGGGMGPGGGGMGPGGGGGMGEPGGGGGMGGRGGGGMGGGGMRGGGPGDPGGQPRGGPGAGFMGGDPPLDGTPQGPPPGAAPRGEGNGEEPQGQGGSPQGRDQNGRRPRGAMGPVPSPQFTIEQEGDSLAFRTERNLRVLRSDGQKRKKEVTAGEIEVVAKVVKGALVVESKPEMGGKRKETYTLRADGKLQIDFDFPGSGPMPGLKFKLVYDSATSAEF